MPRLLQGPVDIQHELAAAVEIVVLDNHLEARGFKDVRDFPRDSGNRTTPADEVVKREVRYGRVHSGRTCRASCSLVPDGDGWQAGFWRPVFGGVTEPPRQIT